MALNPLTPVLVSYGQINQYDDSPIPREPVDLIVAAAQSSAPASLLATIDTISVVGMLSWHYRDPGTLIGQRLGATLKRSVYSGNGGNTPQSMVSAACRNILAGRSTTELIGGAETWRTFNRTIKTGTPPAWTVQDGAVPAAESFGPEMPMNTEAEIRTGLGFPSFVYPLFDQAYRISSGATVSEHLSTISALWSRFSDIAATNPHAYSNRRYTAAEIAAATPENRMIASPYTKLMNANNSVEQGSALIVTSVENARRQGIPEDQWIFPWAGTDAHDTYAILERERLDGSPAIRIGAATALSLAGVGLDEINFVDVYSCYPCAVMVAANEIGLPLDDSQRPLTITGGLTFAGGPWNNYVGHSIATLAEKLRDNPGTVGMITANGGYLSKHAFGVYSTTPPTGEFAWADVQDEVDATPTTRAVIEYAGTATVESWTVPVERDNSVNRAYLAARTPDNSRTLAVINDADVARELLSADIAGAALQIDSSGSATLA